MNANELADDMEGGRFNDINYNKKKAADFVRQQQEQINNLKQWEKRQLDLIETQQAEIEALKNAKRFIQNFAEEQHHRACQLEEAQEADNEPVAWKAYEEVNFGNQYILRWVREGDEYVNRMTKETMEDLKSVVRQQQAEIEELKTCLIVEQEHNERMVEDRSKYEALAHVGGVEAGKKLAQAEIEALKQIIDANNLSQNIGQFVKPDLKIEEVMSEHCACYKLGYNPLNDYRKVKAK